MEEKVDLVIPILGSVGPVVRADGQTAWREVAETAIDLNPIASKLWIYNDGAGKEGEAEVRELLQVVDRNRVVRVVAMGSGGRIYTSKVFNRIAEAALYGSEAEYLVFVHPSVLVESRYWLDTLLQPFVKDKNAATVQALMGGSASGVPYKARRDAESYKDYPLRLQAFRKLALKKVGLLDSGAPGDLYGNMIGWEQRAMEQHWTCWRDNRVRAIERRWDDSNLDSQAFEEVVRRSRAEAMTFVDS